MTDANLVPRGRMRLNEATSIADAPRDCQVLEITSADNLASGGLSAYGFNNGVRIEIPGVPPLTRAPAAAGRSYAATSAGDVWLLDRTSPTGLQRQPEVLREADLGMAPQLRYTSAINAAGSSSMTAAVGGMGQDQGRDVNGGPTTTLSARGYNCCRRVAQVHSLMTQVYPAEPR